MELYEKLVGLALEAGATRAAIVKTADIKFSEDFRAACEENRCRKYGTNHVCPPACGPIDECIKKVRAFETGLVFQYVGQLEDSFDIEGMEDAAKKHKEVFARLRPAAEAEDAIKNVFCLNSGTCDLCEKCTYPDNPCRHPDKAVPSVEAYGIYVAGLAQAGGLPYHSGANTVTYIGLILFE